MLQSAQMRAARALLGWRQGDLAKRSRIGLATIQRLEQGEGPVRAHVSTVLKIESCLAKAGIVFINDAQSIGVRLVIQRRG